MLNLYESVASADAEYMAVLEILGRSMKSLDTPRVWGIHQDQREDQTRNADWSDEGACDLVLLQDPVSSCGIVELCFVCYCYWKHTPSGYVIIAIENGDL